jgi:hypothetical protein
MGCLTLQPREEVPPSCRGEQRGPLENGRISHCSTQSRAAFASPGIHTWYCAPEMGHIEAISARESARHMTPEREKSMPQISDVGPPFCRPNWKLFATPSHEDRSVTDMPRMDSEATFL